MLRAQVEKASSRRATSPHLEDAPSENAVVVRAQELRVALFLLKGEGGVAPSGRFAKAPAFVHLLTRGERLVRLAEERTRVVQLADSRLADFLRGETRVNPTTRTDRRVPSIEGT